MTRLTRRWLLVAPALLAAVILAGCSGSGGSSGGTPTSGTPSTATSSPPSTHPSSGHPTSPSSGSTSSGASLSGSSSPVVHQKLQDFRISDVTFVGSHEWALGSADCLSGGGTCNAIETSSDGGRHWHSAPAPRAGIGTSCTSDCADNLRFASDKVGYAWAPYASGSFFMTTDGGASWQPESGRVAALEALDGNVIRVTAPSGCPPDCRVQVQVAGVGSTSWHDVAPDVRRAFGDGVVLARAGGVSYLLVTQNPAGGAQDAKSSLFVSTDNGERWSNRGEPCPQLRSGSDREVDSLRLTAAPGGSATVLCEGRIHHQQFTATTTDDGRSFRAGSRSALGSGEVTGFGAASSSVVLLSIADTFRSTDGGHSFARLGADSASSPGDPSYIGFATSSLGHAITGNRRGLATTTDAGASWTIHTFS